MDNNSILTSEAISLDIRPSNVQVLNSTVEKESADLVEKFDRELPVDESEAEQVVVQLSELAQNLRRDLLFSVDQKNGGTILKVVDRETEETIREIPSEDIRRIKERMREVSGLLFRDST